VLLDSILVVDDEPVNLDMLSRRLRRSGFAVEVAESGCKALEMIGAGRFDLILLDQMMPELSGSEVLAKLRTEYSSSQLPIIMVTAVAESEKIVEALEAGANDYITKPIDFKVALARIQSLLARKHAIDSLRESEERYAMAARASLDGLWDWNLIKDEIYFSPLWRQMLGLEKEQIESVAATWFSRILPSDREAVMAAVDEHVRGNRDMLQCSYRMLHSDGSVRWMVCRAMVTRDAKGKATRLAGSQSDVTLEKTEDTLTGMTNRLWLLTHLECALERGRQPGEEAESSALLFFDVDEFKTINERLGHAAGDWLLKAIGGRLQVIVSEYDQRSISPLQPAVARMGGDEFAIFLGRGVSRESVEAFATHIQHAMDLPFDLEGQKIHCTLSVGAALLRASHGNAGEVLRDADLAMYTAKRERRGGSAVFDERMHGAVAQHRGLKRDILLAANRNELEIVYQPKVDLKSGLTYGVEALLRWNHPTFGLIMPGVFIPIAEETGAIVEMGCWVLHNACIQVLKWHEMFPMTKPLELSVNLSPREFSQQNLVGKIQHTLEVTAFPLSSLHLEITEGVLFDDLAAARSTLTALKEIGVSLDLDDFGTGYSSLQYLQELPFDLLKIDRCFVRALDSGQASAGELIQTMLQMARNLGMGVVAEGIETLEHSIKLQEFGCSSGQGFYYSRPIHPLAMEAFLAAERNSVPNQHLPLIAPDATNATGSADWV